MNMHEHDEQIPPMMLADGLNAALVGVSDEWSGHPRAIYDYAKCVRILMVNQHMSEEEALEFMDFNVIGAYVGAATPIFMHRMSYRQLNADR